MEVKNIKAFGTEAADAPLNELAINRRIPTPHDVEIDIMFCGVCHSDLHTARNEWHGTTYPVVPGHEIVGTVTSVGYHVTKFKIGDLVAVGCMVDSCRDCEYCQDGLEQYCDDGPILTYNSPDKHLNTQTYGGYSETIVVDENFVLRVPSIWIPLLLRHCSAPALPPIHHSNIGRQARVKKWVL